jgi:hypothetical protein
MTRLGKAFSASGQQLLFELDFEARHNPLGPKWQTELDGQQSRAVHWALKAEARLNKDSLHGSASGTETAG